MALSKNDFEYSNQTEPHRARTKEIIKVHPAIRKLIGRNPFSFLIISFVVTLQFSISYFLSSQPWWLALLIAYAVGAFANHSLYVLIHESTHNLVFKNRTMNFISGIIADLPNVLPSAISFRQYHLKHHSFQGHYDLDADIPSRWEAKLIGNSFAGKALWLLLFPLFQSLRTPRFKEIPFFSKWIAINMAAVFLADILVIYFWGFTSFLYLVFSFFFSIGLHPLGARWIQEHYLVSSPQETYSYYGKLNILALNVGYHNEHHDFPSVPWNKLPEIRSIAGEYYNSLYYHNSWSRLFFKWLSDPGLSLFSRMVRKERGGIPITTEI